MASANIVWELARGQFGVGFKNGTETIYLLSKTINANHLTIMAMAALGILETSQ
jgi:hypothetical protein